MFNHIIIQTLYYDITLFPNPWLVTVPVFTWQSHDIMMNQSW